MIRYTVGSTSSPLVSMISRKQRFSSSAQPGAVKHYSMGTAACLKEQMVIRWTVGSTSSPLVSMISRKQRFSSSAQPGSVKHCSLGTAAC